MYIINRQFYIILKILIFFPFNDKLTNLNNCDKLCHIEELLNIFFEE